MTVSGKVFPEIALSLSGGGYRAAAFHLGTLEMLDELELLENVKSLSTVSGGTITGIAYAVAVVEKISFADFSRRLRDFLRSTNVITTALAGLPESVSINQTERMPSLIRAAARIYASDALLGDRTFDSLLDSTDERLRELSFNATDFRTGNSFRFQKSQSADVRSGNNAAEIKPEINRSIRLADIVAASSCFPSGFEPLRFPSDFVWSKNGDLESIKRELGDRFAAEIPLMDGGVFDNQGIDSIKNIYARKKRRGEDIDLYIVSDTDQRNEILLEFPPVTRRGWLNLNQIYILVWTLQIASIVTVAALLADAVASYRSGELTVFRVIFLYLIPLLFAGAVVAFISWGRAFAREMMARLNAETAIDLWLYFKNLTVPETVELAGARLKSLIAMAKDVFMKRIRDLGYTRIFADTDINRKIVPNQIYDLDKNLNFKPEWGEFVEERKLQPSNRLREAAQRAERYGTNLWFLEPAELDNLIFCGRATVCYKILKYLLRFRREQLAVDDSPEKIFFNRTLAVWCQINEGGETG